MFRTVARSESVDKKEGAMADWLSQPVKRREEKPGSAEGRIRSPVPAKTS